MEHFYQNIEGWFSYDQIYKEIVQRSDSGSHFVEIGSFRGRSSAFMAVEIINSGKSIKFDCIDTWRGSDEHQAMPEIIEDTLYDTFIQNIEPVKHIITPIRMTSVEAASRYENSSLDFIMVDGDHTFDGVCADIAAYLPKLKRGGIMAGDDAWVGTYPRQAAEHMFGSNAIYPTGIHFIYMAE